ncbi:hypothetical protein SAMN04488523_11344 [Sulfitobacter brevis]|uniref:Uncharacterized protein n=1 Tax=Sulfitobacter brevis TaxID=74348 RepID=A0A1I2ET05_9RHOB|nr:hypothetical protein SAMN04488523_11344 [Sulfitobacter brevis]
MHRQHLERYKRRFSLSKIVIRRDLWTTPEGKSGLAQFFSDDLFNLV